MLNYADILEAVRGAIEQDYEYEIRYTDCKHYPSYGRERTDHIAAVNRTIRERLAEARKEATK